MRTLLGAAMALYLGLAPVYWLPGLDPDVFGAAKIALFVVAALAATGAASLEGRGALPRGLLGPTGFALFLLAAAGGLAQADLADAAGAVKDYAATFFGLWAFYLLVRLDVDAERVLLAAALLVSGLCALVASSAYFGAPDFAGPARFEAEHLWVSGFGSVRTGWSNGTALYVVPLLFPFVGLERPAGARVKALCAGGIAAILLSQFAVAGRAGLAASLLALGVALSGRGRRGILLAAGVALALAVSANVGDVKRQMRLVRDDDAAYELDEISSGRLDLTQAGLAMALEHPLFGLGVGKAWVGEHEIHNLWLRLAAESGILAPLFLLLMVCQVLRSANSAARAPPAGGRPFRERAYFGGLVGGLLITLLEPRMLVGAFQVTALWWAFAGVAACRRAATNSQASSAAPTASPQTL